MKITLTDPIGGLTDYNFNLNVYDYPRFQSALIPQIKVRIGQITSIALLPMVEPWPVTISLGITPDFVK
jgi:hypothetical protein